MCLGRPAGRAGDRPGRGCTRQVDLTFGLPVDIAGGKLTLFEVAPDEKTGSRADEPLPYRFTFDSTAVCDNPQTGYTPYPGISAYFAAQGQVIDLVRREHNLMLEAYELNITAKDLRCG
jgi:hypothetical protein